LDGGMFAWAKAGLPTAHVCQFSPKELNDLMGREAAITVVDVRAPGEFAAGHIEGAVNIPAPDLRTRHHDLKRGGPVVAICSTGHRSSLAASILGQKGFDVVHNAVGGMTAYAAAGLAPACPMCMGPHGPRFLGK
ncbi:MAG TPA: rhodanese-like domain-containing protein, partial [Planctomycetota bacterium]|nr:rhodanese-like domain-containing protein [Planctomycetota bacterium]